MSFLTWSTIVFGGIEFVSFKFKQLQKKKKCLENQILWCSLSSQQINGIWYKAEHEVSFISDFFPTFQIFLLFY